MHEEEHLLGPVGGVAHVVEQVPVAVDVDVSDHAPQCQEDIVGLLTEVLLWVAGEVPVMNFSDSLKMSCSVSRPNSFGP